MFVGTARVELVERMHRSFAQTVQDAVPQMWLLTAPSGWGKTRLVQELYARLAAAEQAGPVYWPPAIVDADAAPFTTARKRITPPVVDQAGHRPRVPWMWWGIECFRLNDGSLGRAMDEAVDQIYIHAEALIATERSAADQVGEAFDVSSATVGILALFVGALASPVVAAPLAVFAAGKELVQGSRRIRDLLRRRARRDEGPQASGARFAAELSSKLAHQLEQLGKAVPIILVLDDAHFADSTTVEVLAQLLAIPKLRLMVVALGWPGEMQASPERPFATWLQSLGGAPAGVSPPRIERVDLDALTTDDLRALTGSLAPATSSEVLDSFAERYDNPLALRAALELPRVKRHIHAGQIDLQPVEVTSLPSTVEGVFTEAWRVLPESVRSALITASVFGPRFVPELVASASERAGLDGARHALDLAVEPYQWARRVDRSLAQFTDRTFHQVASSAVPELLSDIDVAEIRQAFAEFASDPAAIARISRRAWIEALASHLADVEAGLLPGDQLAVRSALDLGIAHSLEGDVAEARVLFDRADEWATTPDEWLTIATQRAWLHGLQGNPREAIAMLQEARASVQLAPSDRASLRAENDLAFWISQSGDHERARELFAELAPRVGEALGRTAGLAFTVRRHLAHEIGHTGDFAQAKMLSEQLIPELQHEFGPADDAVLIERSYLAYWTSMVDGPAAAVPLLRDLVPAMIEELGPIIGPTRVARKNLAGFLRASGHDAEAAEQWRALVADLDAYDAPPSHDSDDARQWLAWFHFQSGDLVGAEALTRRALDHLWAPLNSPDGIRLRDSYAYVLWQLGRKAEALEIYHKLLPDARRALGDQNELTVRVSQNISALTEG